MENMRQPSTRYRVAGQAIPEVVEALESTTTKLGRRLRFRGRKLKEGPLLVGLVCYCLTRSDCEIEAMARIGLAKYEEMLNSDEAVPLKQDLPLGGCPLGKGQPAIEIPIQMPNSENPPSRSPDRPRRVRRKR